MTTKLRSKFILSGNQAIARGAYEAESCSDSYPGTPCTEILESLAMLGGVKAMWSINEKVAYEDGVGGLALRVPGRWSR